ncbi:MULTISPECIES: tripartite tricarboxylate transporter substrate binding protein [Comamonas]|nr:MULTISPECIES: tripartite tricarboxylate transporter substrate binding protein [Comamonas]MBD9531034.1 tripartite tricarboxylate transporter substrate binding protein [Comamonas sp. CMM01]BBL25290.1 MFS transporter [Comamonas terrigena NBRC 13299]SUY71129.1 Argininosuccinate lyase [Comamonas terrigena]
MISLTKRSLARWSLASLALLATAHPALAAAYPQKPITLVVGFSAGSSIDMVARAVGNKLSDKLGQPVLIDNKPGAGGNVAAGLVARAPADGYTLLVVANSIAIAPAVYPNLKFDVQKDLRAVAYVGVGPVIMKVSTQRGFQTLNDVVSYAKAHPGALNFGSSGVGGTPHMATELFNHIAGIKMTHIPYKGGSDALAALIGGQIDVLINPLLGDVASDKVRSLAISGTQRSHLAPGVPTFGEAGYPAYDLGVYYGVVAPSHTPADVVQKVNAAINEVLKDPSVVDALTTRSGITLAPGTPAAFQKFIDQDIARWKSVVEKNPGIVQP